MVSGTEHRRELAMIHASDTYPNYDVYLLLYLEHIVTKLDSTID